VRVCTACGSPGHDDSWTCAACGHAPPTVDGFRSFAPGVAGDHPGFRPDYFTELARLEGGSFWFRARNELITWALATYFPRVQRLLEIGCGTGFVLASIRDRFPAVELSGSEVLSAGLAFAATRVPSAELYQMDATSIPFRDHFDVIAAFDVLEHIDDDGAAIDAVARALRPGGGFLMSVPQHPALWSPQDEAAQHVRRYTSEGLRRLLVARGFEILRATSFVSLLLPLMAASRLRARTHRSEAPFDAMDELRHPKMLDTVFERTMAAERRLIAAGVSFPAGGSLLVVARRSSADAVDQGLVA
jgi:SAM-dependent methyltransferase